ncbi:Ldh family oxidoreductase [Rhodoplanes sp. Z2-YC6860]|uniref:Ldh family oxidoreductase n=1 Tax=Rhodoplanes sp. Z2-YC6860 TaxID=674703 RepID=UPI00078C6653|nr:Ldh family oxidoreductase [Rhodoplanes sp. Z2-YC6860]AMN44339.1 malate/L-lactate dehydrogenase [Rhodoplanes sp. Z2-YC6860]
MTENKRYAIPAMIAFAREAFVAAGVPEADAAIAAKQFIEADLTGFDAHGIFRLAPYVAQLKSGRVKAKPNIKVLKRAPSTALVDGDDGIGHLVMTYATNLAIELARETGIGWVGARNSNHAGAAGIYAEMPVAHGMVGIYAAVSTVNHMGPWGGAEPMIGTNPIAVGIPAGKNAPVVLDIATSVSSFGTIRQRQVTGEPLQEGWVIHSKTGEPILDPKKVGEGVLLPIGEHKGAGLALIIGLLAGVLNGAAFGHDVVDALGPGNNPTNTGQFVIALDVSRFIAPEVFAAEMDRHLNDLRSSPTLPGFDKIRLPGEDRRKRRADRNANGVSLPATLIKQLDDLAANLKIEPLGTR